MAAAAPLQSRTPFVRQLERADLGSGGFCMWADRRRPGEAALELLEREAPHLALLISDVVLPGIDGPTLFRTVRETRPGLPVVCISGYSEDALRQRIVDAQGVAFLPKPFSLKQLAIAVKRAVANPDPTY